MVHLHKHLQEACCRLVIRIFEHGHGFLAREKAIRTTAFHRDPEMKSIKSAQYRFDYATETWRARTETSEHLRHMFTQGSETRLVQCCKPLVIQGWRQDAARRPLFPYLYYSSFHQMAWCTNPKGFQARNGDAGDSYSIWTQTIYGSTDHWVKSFWFLVQNCFIVYFQ